MTVLFASLLLAPTGFGLTQASYWTSHWANGPRVPALGDMDGDGRADMVALYMESEGIVDVHTTSKWGKPNIGAQSRRGFGRDAVAGVCGRFAEGPGMGFLSVFADGSVRVTFGMAPDRRTLTQDELAGAIPEALRVGKPCRALADDFDGDGRTDVLLVGSRLTLLRNVRAKGGKPAFRAEAASLKLPEWRQVAAGNGKLYWLDAAGGLWAAGVVAPQLKTTAGSRPHPSLPHRSGGGLAPKKLLQTSPDAGLAAGRFRGAAGDVLVGDRLLVGGDPTKVVAMPGIPKSARGDLPWLAADLDGNGKDDLFRMRATDEAFVGEDRLVHFAYDAKDAYKGFLASAEDGLPDAWKTGQMRPGGLDLKALGCKVGRRDLVLDVQTFDDVSDEELRREFEGVARYFAGLPIANPDGSTGIAVHPIFHPSLPASQKDAVSKDFDRDRPPVEHRGITHWVQVFRGIGGVASIWGCRAQVNETWGCVVHELGHNFGLIHDGYQAYEFSPVYGSVMNYNYSYGIDDSPEKLTYSRGLFVGHDLDERHLSEVLPFPMERVHFLSARPYHYSLKPGPDPNTTLIDWNWNGIYGETDVVADVNWEAGRRTWDNVDLGRANCTPALLATEGDARLLLVAAKHESGDAEPLSAGAPGRLFARVWVGDDIDRDAGRWTGEQALGVDDATGDPSMARVGSRIVLAYPTAKGVVLRDLALSGEGAVTLGAPLAVGRTMGAVPTLVAQDGALTLLLWSGPSAAVSAAPVVLDDGAPFARAPVATRIVSGYPVGATGGMGAVWVSAVERTSDGHNKWRLYSLRKDYTLRSGEYGPGEGAGRLQVLVEPAKGFEATGQAYLFARGGGGTFGDIWHAQRAADPGKDGWHQIRYDFGGPQSRTAPGVCAFRGDWATAMWRQDGTLYANFRGRGIRPEPVRDFDDVGHIARVGLQQSINVIEKD